MEAHNANTHLVQPNFSPGDDVLRAESKRLQHKLTLIWKGPYQVDKVFDNHTLRVNSLINGLSLSHADAPVPGRVAKNGGRPQAAAHFNNTIEFIVDKYGPLSKERTTSELCVLTKWRGFDEEENTEEPLYDKWIYTPRLLKGHLLLLADKGDDLAIQGLEKIKE
jgi:hypothetical protein